MYSRKVGSCFPTKSKMSAHWGISKSTFDGRLRRGWSLEEALTGKRKKDK